MRGFMVGDRGASAVEFALVLPVLMFLFFGIINLFFMVYAQANLHSTTEATARYYSVDTAATGAAPSAATLNTYAGAHYKGPKISPSYTYSAAGTCGSGGNTGHSVSATATYPLNYGFGTLRVPLKTTACFP
jgi:Flp pilus assembly protein TadG